MTDHALKSEILLAALSERYEALRVIRERVQTTGLTVIGLLLGAGGWLIQSDKLFSCAEKIVATAGVLAAIAVLRWVYFSDLYKGFSSQQRVAATIENELGLFTPGALGGTEAIYPETWSRAGQENGPGGFFSATYWMLLVGTAFLIVTIWVSS
jgi:hypothetical protein